MKIEEVRKCSFQNWYKDFKNVSIKSMILPLPDGFVSYILKDGIVLPKNKEISSVVQTTNSDSDTDEEEKWEEIDENDEPEAPQFLEFDRAINEAIDKLSGKVFPKLNWSSPRDASWIAFNNCCCCTSVSDIYLLLKSSDFIVHDLTQRMIQCEDFVAESVSNIPLMDEKFYLVLRKWLEIDISGEFRCFVKDNNLIGICQREDSLYFDHIAKHESEIVEDIVAFFRSHVQYKFPSSKYVFDVYRKKKGKILLMDFNPFGKVTDSLLFAWDELLKDSIAAVNEFPEFRYVDDNHGVQPSTLRHYAVPRDIVDIGSGQDSFKLVDLLKLKIEEQNGQSDGENEENWKV